MVDFAVPLEMTSFPQHIRKRPTLQFTDAGLAHALFVTGRAPGVANKFGAASFWEYVHRAAIIRAYVRSPSSNSPSGGSPLARSDLAEDLDPSEKANLSYSLGQALTAIFCEQVLSVDRMLHIQRYGRQYAVDFKKSSRHRPDLFGYSANGWVVAEAKGRSNPMESTLPDDLIKQKLMVSSISGVAPRIAVGCVAAFSAPNGTMQLHAFDPVERSIEAEEIQLDSDEFALAYYEPFLRAMELNPAAGIEIGDTEAIAALSPAGVRIGLLPAIEDRVRKAAAGEVPGLADDLSVLLDQPRGKADLRFQDGSYFETSWQDSLALEDVSKLKDASTSKDVSTE